MSQAVRRRLLNRFNPRLVHVGFVVNKVAIGQGFPVYFAFHWQYRSINSPNMLVIS